MEKVFFDKTIDAAVASFEGFLTFEEHKKLGEKVLNLAVLNQSSKMLIDTSQLSVIRPETQEWIEKEWFPTAIKSGISHMAFLISVSALGKMSADKVNQKAGPIEIHNYSGN